MSIHGWSFALLLAASQAMAQAPAPAPAELTLPAKPDPEKGVTGGASAAAAAKAKQEDLPALRIWCAHVFDRKQFTLSKPKDTEESADSTEASGVNCPASVGQTLVGTGDVVIVLTPQVYKQLADLQEKKGAKATLFINGVDLGKDAAFIGAQEFQDRAVLQYNIQTGENSKRLWAALYRAGAMTTSHPLNAALGFASGPVTVGSTGDSATIAITSRLSFWTAIAAIAALVLLALLQGRNSDIFRDARTPPSFTRAWTARKIIAGSPAQEEKVLVGLDPAYTPADKPSYIKVADQALKGDLDGLDPDQLAVGLVLLRDRWRHPRASFSLGRVQLGVWFVFAVATGLFLWLVYGDLPALDGSVVALLGLSAGLTASSLAIDSSKPKASFSISKGLFTDLTTSSDDQQQVYRFQAVWVNFLLLGVGAIHVLQHLSYPIFDPTWLAFLGISSAALAAGKTIVESKPDKPLQGA